MRFAVVSVLLLGLVIGSSLKARETENEPVAVRFDDSSRGDLAFGAGARGPWKVARRGETLPADAFLKTSAGGSCRIQIGDGILQLGADSQARVVTAQRQIVLAAGRAYLQALPGWTVVAGTVKGTLAAESSVEIEIAADARIAGKILSGAVEVAGTELGSITVHTGKGFVYVAQSQKLEIAALPPAEIERLRAQAEPPRKPQGLGQLVVKDPQSGAPVRLNLARYHVNVVLHPPVALVQIDQSFYNPYPQQQEGTFVFNLPDGASVSRFAMYTTPTQLVEGELIERNRAANIYQSIVNRKRDPAILEQIGANLFRMRVFPIFSRDTKRILLDFTVPIEEQDEGRHTFELPLMSDLEPVWDFSITGTIRGPTVPGTMRSPSHPAVKFETADAAAVRFAFQERSYRPESAFVLGFQQRPAVEATVRSFVPQAKRERPAGPFELEDKIAVESQCEFLATVSPTVLQPAGRAAGAEPTPVDLLILADTSGGMAHGARLRQVVRTITGGLRDQDRFRLGCVDVDFRGLSKEWVAPGSAAARDELARLDNEFFLGGTEYVASFSTAVKSLGAAAHGRRQIMLYIGDGALPEIERMATTVYRDLTEKEITGLTATMAQTGVRFGAVLLENEPSGRLLMEKLATATGGWIFRMEGASSPELFDWALGGCPNPVRIVSIKAQGAVADDVFAPTSWTPGRALHIFGRRRHAGPMKLAVTFERNGKAESREWDLTLKNDLDDLFVGRLWAQHKLDQLRGAQNRIGDEKQIVALSQEWTLLSPLTAFLVLESEAEYPRYGILRSRRHLYWKPDDAVAEKPLPPEAIAAMLRPPQSTRVREPRTITSDRFYQALASARKALKMQAPNRALVILGNVLDSPLAADSGEFAELKQAALDMLARGDLLRSLGPERGWLTAAARSAFPRRRPIWCGSYCTAMGPQDDTTTRGKARWRNRRSPPRSR